MGDLSNIVRLFALTSTYICSNKLAWAWDAARGAPMAFGCAGCRMLQDLVVLARVSDL